MQVIAATALGMCFGVRDALAAARKIERPSQITVNGQLVHNRLVTRELGQRGFSVAEESGAAIPDTPGILITAHGISDRQRSRLLEADKTLIDTTCPLVKKAHAAALKLQATGFHVLVIGKRGHVEVRGLTGDLGSFDVIESAADIRRWPHRKLGVIAQTTSVERDAQALVRAVQAMNPQAHVRFINTICQPTRDRQDAVEALLDQVDLLVVVGGRNSNNTRQLVNRATARGVPAVHVEDAEQLDSHFFDPNQIVGLTAGTSTLPETIEEVRNVLEAMHAQVKGSAL